MTRPRGRLLSVCVILAAGTSSVWEGVLPSVALICVDTRETSAAYPIEGVGGLQWLNVGASGDWQGESTKGKYFLAFLSQLAATDPTHMVVAGDCEDILFGGCSEGELLKRYRTVRDASGASVVVGAEHNVHPFYLLDHWERYDLFRERRHKVLKAFGQEEVRFGTTKGWSDFWQYQFVNGGFAMGPAEDLRQMYEWYVFGPKAGTDDQYILAEYMFAYPSRMTLDYSSSIVMNMAKVEPRTLWFDGEHVQSNVTGRRQCFVHGNDKNDWETPYGQLCTEMKQNCTAYWADTLAMTAEG